MSESLAYWIFLDTMLDMFATDNISITAEILKLIASIDEFKGAWKAFGTIAPERLQALRRVATIESIGSSTRIEGSKLSNREVEALLSKLDTNKITTWHYGKHMEPFAPISPIGNLGLCFSCALCTPR